MDRRTILERLDAVRSGSQDLDLPEMEGIAQALADDNSLQDEFQRRQSLDSVLAAAMHDVPVPPELKARILTRLSESESVGLLKGNTRTGSWRRSAAIFIAVAATLLVAITLWMNRPTGSDPITIAQLQSSAAVLLKSSDAAVSFNGEFEPTLPSNAWRRLQMAGPIGLLPENGRHRAAAWTFSFGSNNGVIVAVPLSDVTSPPAERPEYRGGNAVSWSENGFVYVCQVDGSIDHLMRQLNDSQLA